MLLVAAEGDVGVHAGPEDGQGAGVGVEQQHLGAASANGWWGRPDMPDDEGEQDVGDAFAAGHARDREAERVVDPGEDLGLVVEVVERREPSAVERVGEEGAVVASVASPVGVMIPLRPLVARTPRKCSAKTW